MTCEVICGQNRERRR